jgi:hypothetical protein
MHFAGEYICILIFFFQTATVFGMQKITINVKSYDISLEYNCGLWFLYQSDQNTFQKLRAKN